MADICSRDSLPEMVTPGLLAVLTLIAVGFALGYAPLGSYWPARSGRRADGDLPSQLWLGMSNAKKLVEDGNHGGKGSEAHAATVIGDPSLLGRGARR